jgi:hypothetical protein
MIATKLAAMNAAPAKQDEFTVTRRAIAANVHEAEEDWGTADEVKQAPKEAPIEGQEWMSKEEVREAATKAALAALSAKALAAKAPKEKEKKIIPPLSPESKRKLLLTPYFPHKTGSRNVQRYEKIKRVAHGTYGTVYQAKDTVLTQRNTTPRNATQHHTSKRSNTTQNTASHHTQVTQEIVALKKFKMQAVRPSPLAAAHSTATASHSTETASHSAGTASHSTGTASHSIPPQVRDGFPKHFLCEINILSCTKHRNLLALREVVLGGSGEPGDGGVFLVLDWMEADMQEVVRDMTRPLTPGEIKCLLRQLLKGRS